jgi:GrpB-like predicted nucleotidyltransferase (UPF0157 family)
MIGLKRGTVELAPHAEEWRQLFAQEEARLRDAVGEHVAAIEHVGSTAIRGISAKPIIDIAVGVRGLADAEKCVRPLEAMGYEYRGENGIPGRYYFIKGEPRTHHLHMVEFDSELWRSHLLFRDYLRRRPEVANEYEAVKNELARKYPDDRAAYTDGKGVFIRRVLDAAADSDAA